MIKFTESKEMISLSWSLKQKKDFDLIWEGFISVLLGIGHLI